jgi:hypothetical protein
MMKLQSTGQQLTHLTSDDKFHINYIVQCIIADSQGEYIDQVYPRPYISLLIV